MKILFCSFCEKTFYTENGLALHYFREHYYNFEQNISYCSLCSFQDIEIASHMINIHPRHCGFCSKVLSVENNHSVCKDLLKSVKKEFKTRKEYVDRKAKLLSLHL